MNRLTRSDLRRVLLAVERRFDRARRGLKSRLGLLEPATVLPYRGYANGERLHLRARVLVEPDIAPPDADHSAWENVKHMLLRYESDEVPRARVRYRVDGQAGIVEADEEGYVTLDLDVPLDASAPDERWRQVRLTLLEPLRDGQDPPTVTAEVLRPPAEANLGVISDIDDTIVRTGADGVLKHWRTVLLNNAHTRTPFAGLAAFYRGLERGRSGQPVNPLFYVSSSPWNLYELFERYLVHHDIPRGPIVLKDFGLSPRKFLTGSHRRHKTAAIERILQTYPDLPFVLVGDSGQQDVEIYVAIARRYPGRIAAIYIRDVSSDERDAEAREVLEGMGDASDVVYGETLLEAASHARERGWLDSEAFDEVEREIRAAS